MHLTRSTNDDLDYAFKGCSRRRKQAARDRASNKKFAKAVSDWMDPAYWRHGITINQGNKWNVIEAYMKSRLNYIRVELLREMFGNNFRNRANIWYLVFRQGVAQSGNQHFHALMAIDGDHDCSDWKITEIINSIERKRPRQNWEKQAHVDWNWRDGWDPKKRKLYHGYEFHLYVAREMSFRPDDYYVF